MNKFLFLCCVCFPLLSKKKIVELQSEVQSSTTRPAVWRASKLLGSRSHCVLLHFIAKPPEEAVTQGPSANETAGFQSRLSEPSQPLTSTHTGTERSSHRGRWAFLLHQSYKTRCVAKQSRCFIHAQIALTFLSVKI